MNTNVLEKPEDAFLPIVGKFAWGVRRGHGTFLTMEFGAPHLIVREPIIASPSTSPRVKRNLAKRRVTIAGHWHFWIQYSCWEIHTANYSVTNKDEDVSLVDEALSELDGQILLSAAPGEAPNSCVLNFDLEGSICMSPSPEIDNDQWSIHEVGCEIISFDNNGKITIEAADKNGNI